MGRIVNAVAVGDQGVGQGAQVDQTVPVGIVAGEAGDLEPEHEAGAAESDIGGEAVEAVALVGGLAGEAEVLVDDGDAVAVPAKRFGPGGQGVLAAGRFGVVLDLGRTRLADVDEGLPLAVGRQDAAFSHRGSPVQRAAARRLPGCAPGLPGRRSWWRGQASPKSPRPGWACSGTAVSVAAGAAGERFASGAS